MITEEIKIANLKCGGCANTIKKGLLTVDGVQSAEVDVDNDQVKVVYSETTNRSELTDKLRSMGYPEATAENGLLLQLKSYVSCAIGRMTDKV